jgi:hypothetical protein
MDIKKTQKTQKIIECNICDFKCIRNSEYLRHIITPKHLNKSHGYKNDIEKTQKNTDSIFHCENCKKDYKFYSGLWRHKKTCLQIQQINNKKEETNDKELIMLLIKQNTELLELVKNGTQNTNINSNNNSHNKTFNLQFFLNETCKDAMNITDFVDSIQLQLSDLENVGRLGYVNGISKIIIKNLNALDETKRPIHCTDTKREILYVKDEDIWKKDNDNDRKCVKKAIKRIAYKNCKLIPEFREKYPDCNKSYSKHSDKYNKMIVEAMGGSGNNDEEKEDKIIQNISKEVQINKKEYSVL